MTAVAPGDAFVEWGWRIPFVASIILIAVGMWVRLSITETPDFQKAIEKEERVAVPVAELFRNHKRSLFLGTFVALVTFVLFYICSAWLLSYNVKVLGIPFKDALLIQIYGSVVFGLTIPFAGKIADRTGRYGFLIIVTILIGAFALSFGSLMQGSAQNEASVYLFVTISLMLMGLTYGVIGAALASIAAAVPNTRPCRRNGTTFWMTVCSADSMIGTSDM